ncbi:MAG: hypothetical protein ACJAYG_002531 [Oceanicoccus sp.]|jgi:hypothetical protein
MLKNIHRNVALAAAVLLSSSVSQAAIVNGFANGGFETGTPFAADSWASVASGYSISGYSRTGARALRLSSRPVSAAVALQNSIEDGGLPPLTAGDTPDFSFWVTGFQGTTGNLTYALRYLDSDSNILADTGAVNIGNLISWNEWTFISDSLAVPVGATSALVEFSQAIGPIGTSVDGIVFDAGTVIIDDVWLGVVETTAVPVPAAAWLFGSALLGLAGIKRKKTA